MQTRHHTANPAYRAALTRYRQRQAEKAAELPAGARPKEQSGQSWQTLDSVTPRQEDIGTIDEGTLMNEGGRHSAFNGSDALMSGRE